jgi:hypothetical protein
VEAVVRFYDVTSQGFCAHALESSGFLIHLAGLSPYAANLCPLSGGVEFAGFRENFGESIGELIEAVLRRAVRERTTEHLEGMLSEQ